MTQKTTHNPCACGGRCKQLDALTNPVTTLSKLSLDTRQGLADLRHKLTLENGDSLTTRSAISACDFLLRNY